jgi:hypothetical protein
MGWRLRVWLLEPRWPQPLPNVTLPCSLRFFHEVDTKLLVEIGPEGARRHNNPLFGDVLLRRGHGRRPPQRRTLLALLQLLFLCVGDRPKGPLKQWGNPYPNSCINIS